MQGLKLVCSHNTETEANQPGNSKLIHQITVIIIDTIQGIILMDSKKDYKKSKNKHGKESKNKNRKYKTGMREA